MKSRSLALALAVVTAATTQMCFAGTPAAKIHATHGPLVFMSYDGAKNTAYLVAPTTITDNSAGKPESETGQWAFVVKNISGTWFIENSSWATEKYAHG